MEITLTKEQEERLRQTSSPWIRALMELDHEVARFKDSGVMVGKNKPTLGVVYAAIELIEMREEIGSGVRDEWGYEV